MNKKVKLGLITGAIAGISAGVGTFLHNKKRYKRIEKELNKNRELDCIIAGLNEAYFPEGARRIVVTSNNDHEAYSDNYTDEDAKLLEDVSNLLVTRNLINTMKEHLVIINTYEG